MSVAWKLPNYNNDGHRGWYSRELRLAVCSVALQPGTMAGEERRYMMTSKKAAIQVLLALSLLHGGVIDEASQVIQTFLDVGWKKETGGPRIAHD